MMPQNCVRLTNGQSAFDKQITSRVSTLTPAAVPIVSGPARLRQLRISGWSYLAGKPAFDAVKIKQAASPVMEPRALTLKSLYEISEGRPKRCVNLRSCEHNNPTLR